MLKQWWCAGLLAIGLAHAGTADAQHYFGWTRLVNAAWTAQKGPPGGQCIDVPHESKQVGTVVSMHECHNGENQRFRLLDGDFQNSRIAVYSGASERCLDVAPEGGKLIIGLCANAQSWRTGPTLAATDLQYCVRIEDNGALGVASCGDPFHPDARMVFGSNWHMSTLGSPYGKVHALLNERRFDCLDVKGASTSPGASMLHYGCNGGANQRFSVRGITGEIYLTVYDNEQMLCLSNAPDPGNPERTEAVPCNRWDRRQAWQVQTGIYPAGGYRLVNAETGRCLDAYADASWVGSWPSCHAGDTQAWLFVQG